MTSQANKLRALLDKPGLLSMPGCHDALSARLIEQAGFEVGFMSGFAVSAARLAMPDTGLISYGEMLESGRNICSTVSIPMFGDGDTGFGNALNVVRTVRQFESSGASAIQLEDQTLPKRCGHLAGKTLVETDEIVETIQKAKCKNIRNRVFPKIYQKSLLKFENSDVNMVRSVAIYYSKGVMRGNKYRCTYKATSYNSKKGKTKASRITVADCPIPKLVPYHRLIASINSINIGTLNSVYDTLCGKRLMVYIWRNSLSALRHFILIMIMIF